MFSDTTDVTGRVTSGPFALPDDPAIRGILYWQWFQPDGANGVKTTEGLSTSIR